MELENFQLNLEGIDFTNADIGTIENQILNAIRSAQIKRSWRVKEINPLAEAAIISDLTEDPLASAYDGIRDLSGRYDSLLGELSSLNNSAIADIE